jgi:hypothetical protein
MTADAGKFEALGIERNELRDELDRARGAIAWVISDILRQQHVDPEFPDHLHRWIDGSILPRLRRAVGWGSGSGIGDGTTR